MRKHTLEHVKRSSRRMSYVAAAFSRLVTAELLEPRRLLSTYTVNTLSDAAHPGPGLLTLRQAVADANAHAGADTVAFSSALFSSSGQKTITLTGGQILLKDQAGATTITGPGASKLAVSGNSASRIFSIDPGVTAVISGLTLTKGVGAIGPDGKYDGGAIVNQGSLTLNSATLTGNKGCPANAPFFSTYGGAIFSSGTLNIQHSTLSGNSAAGNDPTPSSTTHQGYTGAGGAIFSTGTVTITASAITGNSAAGNSSYCGDAMGGAIYDSGKLTITGSTLSSNTAIGGGDNGIPGMHPSAGTGSGGAIFSTTSATLISSTLSGNQAHGGTAGYIANGGAYGGGVWGAGSLVISSATLSNNSILSGDDQLAGNAVNKHADGAGIYSVGSLSLTQSTVSGNSAVGGDGQYAADAGSIARGGGVFAGGALTVLASSITGNHVRGGVGNMSTNAPPVAVGPGGDAEGAGLWCGAATVITNSTIANNSATGGAGGDATLGAPPDATSGGDGGDARGAGIFAFGPVRIFDSTLSGNATTAGAGGAGYVNGENGPDLPPGKKGTAFSAGIFVDANSTRLDNTIVSANKAGGAFNDIAGAIQSTSANNLIGVGGGLANGVHGNKVGVNNPMLSILALHGGTTPTMVPLAGSPAIDAGANSLIPVGVTTDQRGLKRIVNGVVDIGAVEVGASIAGEVFNDVNGNGKLDPPGERGLVHWTVYLDLNKDGKRDTGDISTTTTDLGEFSFSALSPGTYEVRVVPMPSYHLTTPAGGVLTLKLAVGQSSTENLFGEMKI